MSSSDTPTARLTVRSPAELACAVPYLLTFHPDEGSLVVITLDTGRVVFAARADLPDAAAPADEVNGLAEHLIPILARQQPLTQVMLLGYGPAMRIDAALRTVAQMFTTVGLPVGDLLRVTGSRVFTITCDDPTCCPPQGTEFDPAASPIAVAATIAGAVALPDRRAMAARFAPVDGAARDRMREATRHALLRLAPLLDAGPTAVRQAGAQALNEALRQHERGQGLTDDQVAWLSVLLTRVAVRDLAVRLTQPHDGHVTFWAELTRRAQHFVAAPATLLALTAWRCGNGALAVMAAEHALRIDPGYTLAGLLLHALRAGLPPSLLDQAPPGAAAGPGDRGATATHRPDAGATRHG